MPGRKSVYDDIDILIDGVRSQNRRILSKTITLVESSLPSHKKIVRSLVDRLLPYTGNAIRLGISGVPGVGKSTFIESLGLHLIENGHTVAVLTVDPSSKRSGGSVLADKTRMEQLSVSKNAYIRPSPSSGMLGGVSAKTRESMIVCEAAGFDVVIVETVGVGQSEITVAGMVDFFLVLLLARAGDELQGIKKGILEIADALAINKADGDNVEKAEFARKQYDMALHLLRPSSPLWIPPVLTCSALERTGVDTVWQTVLKHHDTLAQTGELKARRRRQDIDWMWSLLEEGLKERFCAHPRIRQKIPKIMAAVQNGLLSSTKAADELLEEYDGN